MSTVQPAHLAQAVPGIGLTGGAAVCAAFDVREQPVVHSVSYESAGPPSLLKVAPAFRMIRGRLCTDANDHKGTRDDWLSPASTWQLQRRLRPLGIPRDHYGWLGFNWEIWTKGVWDANRIAQFLRAFVPNLRAAQPNAKLVWCGPPYTRKQLADGTYARVGIKGIPWDLFDGVSPQVYTGQPKFHQSTVDAVALMCDQIGLPWVPYLSWVNAHGTNGTTVVIPPKVQAQWAAALRDRGASGVALWANDKSPLYRVREITDQLRAMQEAWEAD